MLTADEPFSLSEYSFKNSPESCTNSSFSTDLTSDEDFLTQLSSDLDIPLLLNPGEDELNLLNSFFDKSPSEILSDAKSPNGFIKEEDEFNELQQIYFNNYGPDAFPNLQADVKEADLSLKNATSKGSTKTMGPTKKILIKPKGPYPTCRPTSQVVVLKNPPPTTTPKVVLLENIRAVSISSMDEASNLLDHSNGFIDPKLFKRQQRKIKNRESACLSRKKKKDYLTSLEEKVKDLSEKNHRLVQENIVLKERISQFESGSAKFQVSKNLKQSMALCVFIFVVGINMNSLRAPFLGKHKMDLNTPISRLPPDHHSRSLLWTENLEQEELIRNASRFSPLTMCPLAVNQTESARLALELERWIGQPFMLKTPEKLSSLNTTKPVPIRRKKPRTISNQANSLFSYKLNRSEDKNKNNELQIFSPSPEQMYSEFFEAINRRDDTFYVVSLSDHHMLLPALHHNKTRRPKMSLIMPAMLPNGTKSEANKVQLMQIDCEVLNTRLINVEYGLIPQHLRAPGNSTNSPRSQSTNTTEKYAKKYYKPYFIKKNSFKTWGLN